MDADIMGMVGSYLGMQQANIQEHIQTSILRKALDQEMQSTQKLLNIIPATSNPPHLGNTIDQYV